MRDQRWVVDGSLVMSLGISDGIDVSLWLIGHMHTPEYARDTENDTPMKKKLPFLTNCARRKLHGTRWERKRPLRPNRDGDDDDV